MFTSENEKENESLSSKMLYPKLSAARISYGKKERPTQMELVSDDLFIYLAADNSDKLLVCLYAALFKNQH
ncbi:hypothetical protein [Paenibacillus sp. BJ-4]|uniref:hypothetical protein n=1 Tax=Paenibacillus sp. BJ-4 TaxID=2878097 RepID=UPI001CF01A4A|nr:hypothetical protein [Paenibacillus sp. BJ-4]